jgi:hypothetical protein
MRRSLTAAALALALASVPAAAQAPPAGSSLDANAMGISLSRIQRRLVAETEARSEGVSPLKLEFFVDVYGNAPALRFFQPDELLWGPVPGSAPTHRDMIMQNLPQAFRSPRANFLGMVTGVAMYGAKKMSQWEYDRELALYKKMVEAGKNVPAPQPPK